MSKRKQGRTRPREWSDWEDGTPIVGDEPVERVARNTLYTVIVRRLTSNTEAWPDMIWLSIKRNDRGTVRDWRHLQRIKDELVGAEYEGMEMYPAAERLVDTSNQYHLFVVDDPTFRWPWGYRNRLTLTPDEAAEVEAVQR